MKAIHWSTCTQAGERSSVSAAGWHSASPFPCHPRSTPAGPTTRCVVCASWPPRRCGSSRRTTISIGCNHRKPSSQPCSPLHREPARRSCIATSNRRQRCIGCASVPRSGGWKINVRRSMFDVQCSMFGVRRWTFDVGNKPRGPATCAGTGLRDLFPTSSGQPLLTAWPCHSGACSDRTTPPSGA